MRSAFVASILVASIPGCSARGSSAADAGGPTADAADGNAECAVFEPPSLSSEKTCGGKATVGQYIYSEPVASVVSGENGTLSDTCDAAGNLIEAICERESLRERWLDERVEVWKDTGSVVPFPMDCGGRCVDGRCPSSCPDLDDVVRLISATNPIRVRSCKDGLDYVCAIDEQYPCGGLAEGTTYLIKDVGGMQPFPVGCAGRLRDFRLWRDTFKCSLVQCHLALPMAEP